MKLGKITRFGVRAAWTALALLVPTVASAGVSVGFDVKTLNEVLPAMLKTTISVPITDSRSIAVEIAELRIDGFAPSAEPDGTGHILTHLQVKVPQFGLSATLEPRLSLNITDKARILELRFERAELPLPIATLDIAGFLPPIRFPADSLYTLDGLRDDVLLRSRLTEVKMGRQILRFEFKVDVVPAAGR
ncbi:MAG: hypothetical protein GY720_10070 [bacterium]|nr:hypothetical protein [bacterium]